MIDSVNERISTYAETRALAASFIADVLAERISGQSELDTRDQLARLIAAHPDLHEAGWYDPPEGGIGVVFADKDDAKRTQFPSLRHEEYWPSSDHVLTPDTTGMIYVSPVNKYTGIIGDLGVTFYAGEDEAIQRHLKDCLQTTEDIANFAEVGMPFNVLHDEAQKILAERALHNDWMVSYQDRTGSNFGHHIPWSNETPTEDEQEVINSGDFTELSATISRKRIFINGAEEFRIPETIAFSIEPRLGNRWHPNLPAGYYHAMVTFQDGEKSINTNCNSVFDALGITYMRSRFEAD